MSTATIMIMIMAITTITTAMPMLAEATFQRLLAWSSPAYPIGSFSYSHGLETAVDEGQVRSADTLVDYVSAVLIRGGGWVDAVLLAHGWRAAADEDAFDDLNALAVAFRGSSETALESRQQGRSFLAVTRRAWPHPALDAFAARIGEEDVAHCAIYALACAVHAVPLAPALSAFLHGVAANLVSAGVRLVPLGQTDGQIATARLVPVIETVVARAIVTPLDDLGTAAPLLELASFHHETLYTRLFRS